MSTAPLPAAIGDLIRPPALALLHLAAASAVPDGEVDTETLALMTRQVAAGLFDALPPAAAWPALEAGLMAAAPSQMLRVLRACGALNRLLPELDALFGVPQSADDPPTVDLGEHMLRCVDEAARLQAPLAVRCAVLLCHVGKADSPPEHLPFHYRHIERGLPRIRAFAGRFGLAAEAADLAVLALHEVERVHRATEMRAGSLVAMLDRVEAFERPGRFEMLLAVCGCDFRAYPGRAGRAYPKAALLQRAVEACVAFAADPRAASLDGDALAEARVAAVAAALGSSRWGD